MRGATVYNSLDEIGADRAPAAQAEIPYRFPPPADELAERGLIKRLVHKLPGDTDLDAIARARALPWWRAVAEARPYSTSRYWIFLARLDMLCS